MNNKMTPNPNGFLTFLFALFPGIAQLYIGLTKKGLALLGSFVALMISTIIFNFASYISAIFVIPMVMIYCYSFFDAFKQRRIIISGEQAEDSDLLTQFYQSLFNKTSVMDSTIIRIAGIILIVVGVSGIFGSISNWFYWDDTFQMYYNMIISMLLPAVLVISGVVLIRKGVKKK